MREVKFRALIEYEDCTVWEYYKTLSMPTWSDQTFCTVIVDNLQYTGLKDKNGKEIYEGDIAKGLLTGKHTGQSEVFFDKNCLTYQPFSYLNDYNGENFEVVGNIYENPELQLP